MNKAYHWYTEQAKNVQIMDNIDTAECKSVVGSVIEEKKMCEVMYMEQTYQTEYEVEQFVASLSEAQRCDAQVIVDDDSFVVFYPVEVAPQVTKPRGNYHFDTREPHASGITPEPINNNKTDWQTASVQDEHAHDIAALLASVRL